MAKPNAPRLQGGKADEAAILDETEHQHAGLGRGVMWVWIPGTVLLAGLLIAVSRFAELEHFVELAARSDPRWLLVGVFAQAITYVFAGGVWWLALRHACYPVSFLSLAPLGLAKLFADQALPTGGASGAMLVTAGLRNRRVPLRIAFAAMMIGLLSYYSASLVAASVSFFVLLIKHRMGGALAAVFALFALVTIIIPLFVIVMKVWGSAHIPAWISRVRAIRILLLELAETPLAEVLTVQLFLGTFLFQAAVFGLDALTLWSAFKAIGYDIDPLLAFTGLVAGSIGATIGVVPLGLGTFEGSAVGVLALLNVPVEPALTSVLLFRGLSFWLPMAPGLWFARRELDPQDIRR
ncbi:lysylphosphatidylglycerol synthase transmembrane domain-containing protein [Hoeflea sp.]|uniref:lysylphosphatidylglycerol synthase transmembrane domain-containing protein n=1 Tax=Hoeflea sp. TaxID=1940281 RepID=UPI0019BD6B80|nr:lysylphosphatidylglycerol synthase transmembrane domain-containing protein [Hoeflea sp.]MBC7285172.1 flippase-like domain-containing protein [Hoeflea sp.]